MKDEIDLHKQVLFVWDKNYSVDRLGELIREAFEFLCAVCKSAAYCCQNS